MQRKTGIEGTALRSRIQWKGKQLLLYLKGSAILVDPPLSIERRQNERKQGKVDRRERMSHGRPSMVLRGEMIKLSSIREEKLPKKRGEKFAHLFLSITPSSFLSIFIILQVQEIKFHFLEAFPNYSSSCSSVLFKSSITLL